MLKQFLKILILLCVSLFFEKCAQVAPLTGGEKDTKPPKLIEALPSNKSTNFNGSTIILKFNEFVQLKDLKNQLIITPKLETEPEISASGKKIKIELNTQELLPNTTYRIYFGKSVADMTESNAIQNFEYVFSTGTYIDTLKLKGKVINAFNQKNIDDAIVGLYYSNNKYKDSVAYKQAPDYMSRSMENGEFNFNYLPKKEFKVVAFYDRNKNLQYDGETEKIAFLDENLNLQSDSNINLHLFQELPNKAYLKKATFPYAGKLLIIYNTKCVFNVKATKTQKQTYIYETDQNKEKDTIALYYKGISDTLSLFVTNQSNKKIDTLTLAVPKINANKNKSLIINSNSQNGILNLNTSLKFTFLSLIDTTKTSLSKLVLMSEKDSIKKSEALKTRYIAPNKIEILNKLIEGVNYNIKIDTACFFDFNGKYNDSLKLNFKLQNKIDFGKVTLKLLLNKKQPYIIQFINDKEQVVREEYISFSLSSSNAVSIDFTDVLPGTYQVKILFDDNNNRKWDTGNYLLNKQPEKVIISSKQIKVMSDWDVEEEILVK
jgi:hypothetical protein